MIEYIPDFQAIGSEGQVSFGMESAEGIPAGTATFIRVESESMVTGRPPTDNPNSDPSGLALEPVSLIADCKGKISQVTDVSSLLLLRLNHRGWYEITNPIAGVADWEIRNAFRGVDTPIAAGLIDSLWFDIFRGEKVGANDRGHLIAGAKCSELSVSASANQFQKIEHSFLYSRESFMGDAEEISAPADFAGTIHIFGHRNDPGAKSQIRMRITTGGAFDGTAKGKFTRSGIGTITTAGTTALLGVGTEFTVDYTEGDLIMISGETVRTVDVITDDTHMTVTVAASTSTAGHTHYVAYGATEHPLVANTKIPVVYGDESRAGIVAERENVYIVIVPATGDTGTVNDEWGFDAQRGVGVPVYNNSMQLTGVDLEADCTIGGVTRTYALNQLDMKYTKPLKLNYGLGDKYPFGVIRGGGTSEMLEITCKRDFTDLDFYRGMIAGSPVAFHALAETGPITGIPGYYEQWEWTSATMRATAAGSALTTKDALPESITLRGYTNGSTALLVEKIRTGILSL